MSGIKNIMARVGIAVALGAMAPSFSFGQVGAKGDSDKLPPWKLQAGGESSVGADDYRVLPAWFRSSVDSSPVSACLMRAPDFGVSEEALAMMVRDAFSAWGSYIRAKKLTIGPDQNMIATRLDLRPSCRGDESLRFYFGIEDEKVKAVKSRFVRPFGFAELEEDGKDRAHSSSNGPWGKGFIWIAGNAQVFPDRGLPQWSGTQDALKGLILHEIGHVFGNSHLDGTVMTEKIGQYLEEDSDPGRSGSNVSLYSQIDSQIELIPCLSCRTDYPPAKIFDEVTYPGDDPANDWKQTFQLLVGHAPVGEYALQFRRTGSPEGTGKIMLRDQAGLYEFPVKIETFLGDTPISGPMFVGQCGKDFHSFSTSYYGSLTATDGRKIQVALTYNVDKRKVRIIPVGGSYFTRPIFVSQGPEADGYVSKGWNLPTGRSPSPAPLP